MGWCSGTYIFDDMTDVILKMPILSTQTKRYLIKKLAMILRNNDWDCEYDSKHLDNPLVMKVFRDLGLFNEPEEVLDGDP